MQGSEAAQSLVAQAESAQAAIRLLYEHYKALSPKASLAFFCARAGVRSKGYLADVLSGRRKLNVKFAAGLAAAFALTGPAATAFKLLVELEDESLDAKARTALEERLKVLRRTLAVERAPLPAELARMAMAFEVYSAFGLFKNAPRHADLLRYFGERHARELDAALALLERHALIATDGDVFRARLNAIVFGAGGGFDHLDFLRSSLRDAERQLKTWFPKRDEAYVESVILSVRRADYVKMLPLLRERMLEARTALDVEDADMLVRFNVQIYPVRSSGS